ncbi:MAG: hypothetical protein FWC68_03560 [Oscillospiraceae bacterium]|nr:hypothetical protein [Oscillospiraceae bacterium]
MSWEVLNIKEVKCPCGKGKIKKVIKSDDWNRIKEETPYFECNECLERYKIEQEQFSPKPKHDYTIYYCINKKDNNEKIKLDL